MRLLASQLLAIRGASVRIDFERLNRVRWLEHPGVDASERQLCELLGIEREDLGAAVLTELLLLDLELSA